jgi:sortase A
VLCGHNGSRYGEFFTKLNQVEAGDVVTLLDTDGVLHSYEVTESFVVGPYDNSIKTQGDTEELTLFTCAERGTKRFVVKCVPVREEGAYGE